MFHKDVWYFCVRGEKMGCHRSHGLFHLYLSLMRVSSGPRPAPGAILLLSQCSYIERALTSSFTLPSEMTRQLYVKILLYLENFRSLILVNVKWCWLFESKLSMMR